MQFVDFADWQFATNLFTAVFLGSLIGLERQWRQRMAGLRTNALVSTGSALFILFSQSVAPLDMHVAAQIVTGIGFLGAGVIMKEGLSVKGLNTAATIWCSAAVGTLAGFGFGFRALIATLAVLCVNLCLRPVAQSINRSQEAEVAA